MTVGARHGVRLTLAGILAALPAAGLAAFGLRQAGPIALRADPDLVIVDAVVTNERDQPVGGLTAADFSILDSGQPQQIAEFHAVALPAAGAPQRGAAWSFGPPGSVTNQHAPLSRLFVVLVDDTSIPASRAGTVRDLLSTLVSGVSPDDRVAIFYAARPDLAQEPTGDKATLRDALGRIGTALQLVEPPGGSAPPEAPIDPSAPAPPVIRTLGALAASLQTSSYVRRAILLVSAGADYAAAVQLNPQGQWEPYGQLRTALDTARQAGVPVYTIDPRSAQAPEPDVTVADGRSPVPDRAPADPAPADPPQSDNASAARTVAYEWGFLRTVALDTGGIAALGTANLTGAVRRLLADNSTFYVLGYRPATPAHDGRVHDIDVRVNRPGLRVRAPTGYVAPLAALSSDTAQRLLRDALAEPLPLTGVALRATLPPVRSDASLATLALDVIYPPLPGRPARVEDAVTVTIIAVDAGGALLTTSTLDATVSAAAGSGDTAVTIRNTVALPIRTDSLKIGVASRALGRIGTLVVPVVRR
jgi:VWFA-related protein